MFKKVLLITIAVVALITVGLTVYVSNMDWNSYKNDIAARFSKTMGKKIEFSGNLSVSLWPKPHLSARNVNILNPVTSEKIASVKNMEAQLSLRALLEGTPEIDSLSLNDTEIWYVLDENGISNWRQQQKGMFLDTNIEFNRQTVSVQNSWLHYQNKKYEIEAEFSQINADIVAESLVGPYRIDGNFVYAEDNYGFAVGLGDISQTDDIFLNFAVTNPRSNSYILYDGNYNMASGAFKGNFSGEAQLLATLINSVSGQEILPDMFNVPFVFSVVLDANSQMVTMNSLALKYAEVIEGSGNVKIPLTISEEQKPTIDVQYQFLNLDARLLMMFGQMAWNAWTQSGMHYNPQTDFDVNFDLLMQRMAVSDEADGALENVSAKGYWADNELNLDEFYAACPGNIVWTMSGSLLADNDVPNLFLKTRIEGKNIGALARAFGYPLTAPSQSAFRNVDINFNLAATPQEIVLSDLKVMLDKALWEGTLKTDFSAERLKYELVAQADNINLDNYIGAPEGTLSLTEIVKQDLLALAFLQKADLSADLTIEQLMFRGVQIKDFAVELTTDADIVDIKRIAANDILGAKISVDTIVKGLEKGEPTFVKFNYALSADNISPLITKLNLVLPQWDIFKDKSIQANGSLTGSLQKAEIDATTILKNTRFTYKGEITQNDAFEFSGLGELKSTGFSELVNNLGGHWEKLKNNSAVNCRGHLEGKAQNWSFTDAQCVLGTAQYSGNLNLRQEQNLSYISGNIDSTEFDLANVLDIQNNKTAKENNIMYVDDFIARPSFGRDAYNFEAYRSIVLDVDFSADQLLFNGAVMQDVSAHIKNEQNILSLNDLIFNYKQAQYTGKIQIDYAQEPQITGKVNAENIAFDNIGGKVYKLLSGTAQATIDFKSSARSEEDFMQKLNGEIGFKIFDLKVMGINLAAIEEDLQQRMYAKGMFQMVRDNLQSGQTDFKICNGKIIIKNGVWQFVSTVCENDSASLNIEGQDNINDWQMNNNMTIKYTKLKHLPALEFALNGAINKPTPDVNVKAAVQQYDAHWAQVEQEKQAEIEALQKDLNIRMTQAQENVSNVSEHINKVTAQLENYLAASIQEDYTNWYRQKIEYLQYMSGKIDEMQALARQADWQATDIEQINKRCTEYTQDLEMLQTELQTKYQQDLEAQIQNLQEEVRQIKTKNTDAYNTYLTELQEKFSQIIRYDATLNPMNEQEIQELQEKIAQQRDLFWNTSYQISDAFMSTYALTTSEDWSQALNTLKTQVEKLRKVSMQMERECETILALLDEKIANLEKIQEARKKRQQEVEQKIQQINKDNLLVEKEEKMPASEVISIPSEALEEIKTENIKEVESDVAPQKRPTLREVDESIVLGGVSGTISQTYQKQSVSPKINSSSGLLRTIEGDINDVSGSISVK